MKDYPVSWKIAQHICIVHLNFQVCAVYMHWGESHTCTKGLEKLLIVVMSLSESLPLEMARISSTNSQSPNKITCMPPNKRLFPPYVTADDFKYVYRVLVYLVLAISPAMLRRMFTSASHMRAFLWPFQHDTTPFER